MDNPRFMRVAEAAEYLRVGRDTVRHWLNTGYLKGEKVGRQWQIPVNHLGLPEINVFTGSDPALAVLHLPGGNMCPLVSVQGEDKEARQKVAKRTKELEQRGWKRIGSAHVFPPRKPPKGSRYFCEGKRRIIQVMECTPEQYQESKDYKGEKE